MKNFSLLLLALIPWFSADANDRINLWPLATYDNGDLELLGPIFSWSDEDVALRPLFAVKRGEKPRLRTLYPWSQLQKDGDPNWIFPMIWGPDYAVAFPFYWHFDEPYGPKKDGMDGLFPAYLYFREGANTSLHLVWPFFKYKNWNERKELQFWPLYSRKQAPDRDQTRLAASLIGWGYNKKIDQSWSYAFPLYGYEKKGADWKLLSPIYSAGEKTKLNKTWSLLFPAYYKANTPDSSDFYCLLGSRSKSPDKQSWMFWPLLTSSKETADTKDTQVLAPLSRFYTSPEKHYDYVFPFYLRHSDEQGHGFYTIPYSQGVESGQDWKAIFPLVYHESGPKQTKVISLLHKYVSRPDENLKEWIIWPLLSGQKKEGETVDTHVLAPFSRFYSAPEKKFSYVIPFYYNYQSENKKTLYAFPYLKGKDGSTEWNSLIPLWFRSIRADGKEDVLVSPLVGWEKGGETEYVYPLTPLIGAYQGKHQGGWVFPLARWKTNTESEHTTISYLLFGGYEKTPTHLEHKLWPLYDYTSSRNEEKDGTIFEHKNFDLLLLGDYYRNKKFEGNELTSDNLGHGFWPIWSHRSSHTKNAFSKNTNVLLAWSSNKKFRDGKERVRKRLFWKLWDYQREDEQVKVDMFPAITYDKKASGAKKFSLLWRFLRYEKEESGNVKVDLLFVPLNR